MTATLDADVLIVGAGPVGLMLGNLLARHGVRVVVAERNMRLEGEPRAVTLDDESLRTLQAAGLADAVLRDVVLGYGVQYFGWNGRPLAAIQPTRQEFGYPKRNAFRQPLLVQALHQGLGRYPEARVLFGHELRALQQDDAGVRCELRGPQGEVRLAAAWVVACDGGRSTLRELLGITLDGDTYPERWLIVDLAERTEPLRHTRTYCDPRRPAIRLPGPQGTVRYEFMVKRGERDEDVLHEPTFRDWIARRVPEDAGLPLVRKAVYGFHARVATRWRAGRVFLAGDAAHLTPPFAGQGLNSGLRDAANLAWKLAAVLRWGAPAELLESYEPERRPHAAALIRMALRIGRFMQPKTVPGAIAAQTALRLACLLPPVRDYILQLRFKPRPMLTAGHFEPGPRGARAELVPQPWVEDAARGRVRLDEVLGDGWCVLGWDSPAFRARAAGFLPAGAPGRVVALLRPHEDFIGPADGPSLRRIRDLDGLLGGLLERHGVAAMLVRPDRYWSRLITAEMLHAADLPYGARARAETEASGGPVLMA